MKNLFRFFAPAVVATVALVACEREMQTPAEPEAIHITVKATAQDLANVDTRTFIDTYQGTANTILWGTGEYMNLAITAGENTTFATSTDDSADTFNGDPEAMFEFSVTPESANEYVYQGLYPASAASTSSNTNAANYKVNLPAIQNATASSYDPAAYIMVAKPETFSAVQTDWKASFRRATALNKITLKNLESGVSIKRVKITAEGKKLAGGRHFNLTTGEGSDVYGTEPTIEVHYATPLSGTNVDVWFTSWDVEIAESEKLTIVAYTTDKKSYTKEITVPAGKTIKFQEGYLNTLGANLSGISSADVTEFEAGDYVVLAKSGSDYFALKAEKESGKERLLSVEYTGNLDAYNGDAELVWTITKSGDSFIFENDSKYLGYKGSSNESYWLEADANWTEDNYLLDVTPQETAGQYYVTLHSDGNRYLSKNSSGSFFAFYGNTNQKADIVFVPATVDTRTPVTLSFAEDAINKTTANYSEFTGQTATASPSVSGITYAIEGDNIGTITAATGAVVLNGNTGSATVTATFAGDATYRPASASYTITVASASGPVYTKVTALSDVTAGTYVIVNDGYYLPNAAATNAGPVKNNNTKVTVSGNNLSGVTDEMTWSFTGSASEMTIKSTIDGDYYLLVTGSNNNNLRVNTTSHTWTISDYSGTSGAFSLKDNSQNRYCATYSAGSDWRSYNSYNAGNYGDGGRIYLYKLDDSNVTPKVATPTISLVGSDVSIACSTSGATIYYTVDGSDPSTSSSVYSTAISLVGDQQKTIKAFAVLSGYDDSEIVSETYYAININAMSNGSVTAVPFAVQGDEVSLTVNPDAGYALDQLSVLDENDDAVAVANNKFTMPASPVTVSATFALIPVTTIADALGAPGTYEVPNVAVYAVKGNALILGDASGKIYAFKSGHSLSVGDVRTVSGSTIWYNSGDVYEFDSPTFSGSGTTTINHGSAVEFADNAATLQTETGFASTGSGAAHTAVYVHAIGDQSGRNITTSNGKVLYLSAAENATDGKTVEVYGYVYAYSASHTNFNFLATSIEEYVDPNAKSITALKSSISGVSADGVTNASESGVYSLTNASDSDVTVTPDGTVVTAASISGGALTYTVAANTGSARSGSVTLAVTGGNSISVTISQLAGAGSSNPQTYVDVLTASCFAATSTTYTDFSGKTPEGDNHSSAVYAGNSAKTSTGGIQLRSKNSNSGIVTTTSGGKVKSVKITVESGSNTVDIYGKNSAYTAASDLYSSNTQGTKIGSTSSTGTITITGDYQYLGIRSNNGALYLTSIEITWEN